MIITNRRNLVKRSTVSGVVPTIPGSGATSLVDHTKGGWLATDIYSGEFFANTADKKLWIRLGDEIVLLGYSGMTGTFLNLADTPNTYANAAGSFLVVNSGGTGIDFFYLTAATSLFHFPEFVSTFNGYAGYSLVVNQSETGLELQSISRNFLDLTDVSINTYTPYYFLRVNDVGSAIEQVNPSSVLVDLNTNQDINGIKTFNDPTIFKSDVSFYNTSINFSGITENVVINDIISDTSLTYATNNSLATAYAIKTYVDVSIAAAAGITGYTGNWVTTDTPQTISGSKTFTSHTQMETLSATTIKISGDYIGDKTSHIYLGQEGVDGSYRIYVSSLGDLMFEKYVEGIGWVFKGSI